nr:GDP-mannose 4,6-dehydratase [Cytobacillus solani]
MEFFSGDLRDMTSLAEAVQAIQTDQVYNLAA